MEARWQWIRGAQNSLERPLLQTDEERNGTVFRHGTTKLGPLLVAEEIVGAVARLRRGSCWFWTD